MYLNTSIMPDRAPQHKHFVAPRRIHEMRRISFFAYVFRSAENNVLRTGSLFQFQQKNPSGMAATQPGKYAEYPLSRTTRPYGI